MVESNIMGIPVYNTNYPNLNTFPQLGAFPGEVGSGNSPGGIGGTWPMQLPLSYWWNFGASKKNKRTRKARKSKKNKRSKKQSKKSTMSKKCKTYLQKKIAKNMEEWKNGRYKSRQQALAVSYAQTKRDCK
jgi:hypothetical protein